jgi:hypothetical protein
MITEPGKRKPDLDRTLPDLSSQEEELLIHAAASREIRLHQPTHPPKWISAGTRTFGFEDCPGLADKYEKAVLSLCRKELAYFDGGIVYRVTDWGCEVAKLLIARLAPISVQDIRV